MREPCGNTQAEIEQDRASSEFERSREHAEAMELLREAKADFIAKLMRNEPVTVKDYSSGFRIGSTYTLAEAIGQIDSDDMWDMLIRPGEDPDLQTFAQAFADDPDLVCEMFVQGKLDQFKILIQHEVERLADNVRF
jgi:hypothetical protein